MPKRASPVTLIGVSSRACRVPINLNAAGDLIAGSALSAIFAASAASSP